MDKNSQHTFKLNSVALSASELCRPSDRRLSTKLVPTFLRAEGVAWSAQPIPTAVNLGFLDWSRYFFIQVAPQLSSRG
jgi:hypothetical protein